MYESELPGEEAKLWAGIAEINASPAGVRIDVSLPYPNVGVLGRAHVLANGQRVHTNQQIFNVLSVDASNSWLKSGFIGQVIVPREA